MKFTFKEDCTDVYHLYTDRVSSIIRPSDSAITPLGERDVMPDGKRLFQLVNTYPIKLSEKLKVTPSWPIMDNLYDSAFSVLTTVKDPRGRIVKFASLYGSEVEMEKGEYTVNLQMQNSEYKILEALKNMPMTLSSKLPEKAAKLSLTVHRGSSHIRIQGPHSVSLLTALGSL
jgi:tripeptidyl-peptidase-2